MNAIKQSWHDNRMKILFAAVLGLLSVFGMIDPAAAAMGFIVIGDVAPTDMKALEKAVKDSFDTLQDKIKAVQDVASKALEEVRQEGTLHKETNTKLTELSTSAMELQGNFKKVNDRMLELEQKIAHKPSGTETNERKTVGQTVIESAEFKEMLDNKRFNSAPISIERKTITNPAPLTNDQPLVAAQRVGGIIVAPERRLTIRDLLPQIPAGSNLIEYTRELVYTNSAAYQGATASPVVGEEGQAKAESQITFELAQAAVVTIAHWLGASRQVLQDAAQLAGYINTRLGYGLKLKEESELLDGAGTAGTLNGLRTAATAFTGGATNQTALDTLLKAFLQCSLSEYEATAVVMHPTDWTGVMLLKDTTGRYLFSDPHSAEQPRVWGKPVVATQSMTLGQFLTGAFDMGAAIYDSETMTIRVTDSHSDFFVKNLIAILCEERLALAVYRPAAFIKGGLSYAG
jgi:HK97 family phage major capsid protein